MNNNGIVYRELLVDLDTCGDSINDTKESIAAQINVNPKQLMTSAVRLMSPYYLAGELIWSMGYSNSLKHIAHYSKFWNKISDDGITVRSAYFWQFKEGHGFNQISHITEMLKENPSSRQAILHLHHAHTEKTKDEICTLTVQFLIRNEKLHMIVTMRSNDVILGLPYDTGLFSMLQHLVATKLRIEVGEYTHQVGSLHLYHRDIEKLKWENEENTNYELDFTKKFFENIKFLIAFENIARSRTIILNLKTDACLIDIIEDPLGMTLALIVAIRGKSKEVKLDWINHFEEKLKDVGVFQLLKDYEGVI